MKTVAIVGASGLVGEKLVEIAQDKIRNLKVRLFGNTSVGQKVDFGGKRLIIESCDNLLQGGIDYALFTATEEIAKQYVPVLANSGTVCIDNSAYFRLKKDVPLVVPSINGSAVENKKIIANPNCSTIQTVMCVNALKSFVPVKMTAVTYQSVSGAGKNAVRDLKEKNGYGKLQCFKHPICDNIIPKIGNARADGYTTEEQKLVDESRKILDLPRLKVNSFCARVPVSVGHGVFVNLECKNAVDIEEARELLKKEKNVILMDDVEQEIYPMPKTFRNTKYVGVGRITLDKTNKRALNMFIVADNLLRGAAYNAYEILQTVTEYDGVQL